MKIVAIVKLLLEAVTYYLKKAAETTAESALQVALNEERKSQERIIKAILKYEKPAGHQYSHIYALQRELLDREAQLGQAHTASLAWRDEKTALTRQLAEVRAELAAQSLTGVEERLHVRGILREEGGLTKRYIVNVAIAPLDAVVSMAATRLCRGLSAVVGDVVLPVPVRRIREDL